MEQLKRRMPTSQESQRMSEVVSDRPLSSANGTGLDEGEQGSEGITLISGASLTRLPLVGLPLERARALAAAILNLDSQAPALVNGQPVNEEYALQVGDTLEFVHHAGEKGGIQ